MRIICNSSIRFWFEIRQTLDDLCLFRPLMICGNQHSITWIRRGFDTTLLMQFCVTHNVASDSIQSCDKCLHEDGSQLRPAPCAEASTATDVSAITAATATTAALGHFVPDTSRITCVSTAPDANADFNVASHLVQLDTLLRQQRHWLTCTCLDYASWLRRNHEFCPDVHCHSDWFLYDIASCFAISVS